MANYTKEAVRGSLWVFAGIFVSSIFGYLLRFYLARELTVAEYGLVYSVLALIGIVEFIKHLGLGEAVVRFTARYRESMSHQKIRDTITTSYLISQGLAIFFSLVTVLMANYLSNTYFKTPLAIPLVYFAAVVMLLPAGGKLLPSIYSGFQDMRSRSGFLIVRSVAIFLFTVLFMSFVPKVHAPILAFVGAYVIACAIFIPHILYSMRRMKGRWRRWNAPLSRKIFMYSIPAGLTTLGIVLFSYTDTVMLTAFSTLEEVGLYQSALPISKILLTMASVMTVVYMPLVSRLWLKKDIDLVISSAKDMYRYTMIIFLPGVFAFLVFPDVLLTILFGAEFVRAETVLRILGVTTMFTMLRSVNICLFSGMGLPQKTTVAVLTGATLNVLLNFLLVPSFGGVGAATATLISTVLVFSITEFLIRKQIKLRFPVFSAVKIVCASILFGLVLFAAKYSLPGINTYVRSVVGLVVAGAVYAATILLIRVLTVDEIKRIVHKTIK